LRVAGVFHRFLPILLVGMCAAASAQESVSQSPPPTNQPRQENGELGAIRPYLGMKVRSCLFPGLPEADQEMLRSVIAIKSGEVISRDAIHDSMQALGKLTTEVDGRRRIVSDPPLVQRSVWNISSPI